MKRSVVVGIVKFPHGLQMLQVVILCQEIVSIVHLLQHPGVNPFTVMDQIFIIIKVTDHIEICKKAIKLNIGVLQQFLNDDLFKINPIIHRFVIV